MSQDAQNRYAGFVQFHPQPLRDRLVNVGMGEYNSCVYNGHTPYDAYWSGLQVMQYMISLHMKIGLSHPSCSVMMRPLVMKSSL